MVVDVSCMIQDTMGLLSKPNQGAAVIALVADYSSVASWRMRVDISRSYLVMIPPILVSKIKALVMSYLQG